MERKIDLNKKPDIHFHQKRNSYSFNRQNINDTESNYDQNNNNDNSPDRLRNTIENLNNKNSFKNFKYASDSEKFKILMKNPVTRKIIIFGGLLAISLLIIVYIIMVITGIDEEEGTGEFGFNYYPNTCTKIKHGDELIEFEDYVARVVAGEVGNHSEETIKVIAIATRTYIIHKLKPISLDNGEGCYYDDSDLKHAYAPNSVTDKVTNAVKATRSLIITINGNVAGGHHDAACVYTASQASSENSTGNYSNNNYYIKYGNSDIGGINFQEIPKDSLDKFNNVIGYYAEKSVSSPCANNHGMGISQEGSEYLSVVKGYNWQQIIDYYYQDNEEIMSITKALQNGAIFRQGDPAWGSIKLGNSSSTMSSAGCAVTSIAIGISFSGTPTNSEKFDAGTLIKQLNKSDCFTNVGYIKWACSGIREMAPNLQYVSSNEISGSNESKIEIIKSYPLDKYIIITHFANAQHYSHYVNFQEFLNNDEYVARDPSPGQLTRQKISEIDQIVIYSY